MNILVDSDIVIEVLRSRDPIVLSRWETVANSTLSILYSPVTVAEVWTGARPPEFENVSQFFLPLSCVPANHEVGELAGAYLRQYAKSHNLKLGDALIAATAVKSHAQLWTRNHKHYPMPELSFY